MSPKLLVEFMGTFFLVLIVALASASAGGLAPVAIGCGLAGLIYMGGPISGAHYNPAVTLALLLLRKVSAREAAMYWAAQFLGGAGAAGLALQSGNGWAPSVRNPSLHPFFAFSIEALFTLLLVMVVLSVAVGKRFAGNGVAGVAIGMTVLASIFAAGPISGAALNPAVGLGPTLVCASWSPESLPSPPFRDLWLFLLGPIVGAASAAGLYRVFEVQSGQD